MPELPPLGTDGFYHPASEEQIQALVVHARDNGLKVRVRGAMHSVNQSILASDQVEDINIKLDLYRNVSIYTSGPDTFATVQAGCNLGEDPSDRSSTLENSLLYQLDRQGYSLVDFGGITHQTVSGFLSTGSSGSTLHHSNYDQIEAIRIVDGNGNVHEFSRSDADTSRFFAAGVSAGLMGVISTVTLRLVPSYHVRGIERVDRIEDCEFDMFGPGSRGRPSLEQYFRDNEFVRLLWWPLADPPRVVTWKAKTMQEDDYDDETGPPDDFMPRPYNAFGAFPNVAQRFVSRIENIVTSNWPPGPQRAERYNRRLPRIINNFVPLDRDVKFWDDSWKLLPMDNQIDEDLIPLEFAEMKLPLSLTGDVMRTLRPHYEQYKVLATGAFGLEIYSCKSSDFWLSPAYGSEPFLKIDVIWFRNETSDPVATYFPQFWNLLSRFGIRFHWGKYMPAPSQPWRDYIKRQYPKWNDWKTIRDEMDPHRIFVTNYWRDHLGL